MPCPAPPHPSTPATPTEPVHVTFAEAHRPSALTKSYVVERGRGAAGLQGYRVDLSYYSNAEDKYIINYILDKKLEKKVKGKKVWSEMECKGMVGGRTWQSLKQRYLHHLVPQLHIFPWLQEAEVKRLREGAARSKRATRVTKPPPSPAPALPSKSVTTSPRLITVSRAVEMAALASFQEGCRNYVLGLKGGGAKEAA